MPNQLEVFEKSITTTISADAEFRVTEEATLAEVVEGVLQSKLKGANVDPGSYTLKLLITLVKT